MLSYFKSRNTDSRKRPDWYGPLLNHRDYTQQTAPDYIYVQIDGTIHDGRVHGTYTQAGVEYKLTEILEDSKSEVHMVMATDAIGVHEVVIGAFHIPTALDVTEIVEFAFRESYLIEDVVVVGGMEIKITPTRSWFAPPRIRVQVNTMQKVFGIYKQTNVYDRILDTTCKFTNPAGVVTFLLSCRRNIQA